MIDQEEIQRILKQEVEGAVGYIDDELSADRIKALEYYLGEKFGNEEEGRSQVVSRDVADTVDHIMPSLMRIFSTTNYVKYAPRTQNDVEAAAQATDLANYVIERAGGFRLLACWMKDALLFKLGVLRPYYDEKTTVVEEIHNGLSAEEYEFLLSDDVEVVEAVERGVMAEDGVTPVAVYDVTVNRKTVKGEIKIDAIPPEEFLIESRAKSVEDARFVAHRTEVTASDLVAMGYDKDEVDDVISELPEAETEEESVRFEQIHGGAEDNAPDPTMRKVIYVEAFLKIDADGDGIAETRRICAVGPDCVILKNEVAEEPNFALLTPILMPHRAIGQSVAEKQFDVQLTKSTLQRQTLDNIYQVNNSRVTVVDGAVNLDDLMTNRPGGIVRQRAPGQVAPLSVQPIGSEAMAMLRYMDEVKEARSGVSRAAMGLNADALQSTTASAVNATVQGAQQQIEMIARVFAETGFRDLFKYILALIVKHQDEPMTVRLRDKFVEIDPRGWSADMDVTINVGLGTGQTQEKMSYLQAIAAKQEQILQTLGVGNPLATPAQYAETLRRMVDLAGFKDTESFFGSPEAVAGYLQQQAQQPQQQGPDPKVMAEIETARMKAQAEIELAREKAMADIQLAREKAAAEMDLKREELAAEAQLEAVKVANGLPGGQGNIPAV